MASWRRSAAAAFTTSLVTVSTSGNDRFVLMHVAASSSASMNVYVDSGTTTRVLGNYVYVQANTMYDFGPWFISSSELIRTNADVVLGHYSVEEEAP